MSDLVAIGIQAILSHIGLLTDGKALIRDLGITRAQTLLGKSDFIADFDAIRIHPCITCDNASQILIFVQAQRIVLATRCIGSLLDLDICIGSRNTAVLTCYSSYVRQFLV